MSGHTPGPWKPAPHSGAVGTGILAETDDYPHPWVLCLRVNGRTDEERAANVNLLAAAPELLEALEALGAMPDGYCFCSHDRGGVLLHRDHEPECADARVAIAKARGDR